MPSTALAAVLPPNCDEAVTLCGFTATPGLLVSTPAGSCCEVGGVGGVDCVDVGSDGAVGGGGMSTAGGLGSTGGLVFVVDPVFVDVGADELLVVEPVLPVFEPEAPAFAVESLAAEPLPLPPPPPPPQATSNVATARPMSAFLFTFLFLWRHVQFECSPWYE